MSLKDKEDAEKESDSEATTETATQPKVEESSVVLDKPKTSLPKVKAEQKPSRSGLEAADIVQDALQLDLDDELNEDRDVRVYRLQSFPINNHLHSRVVNIQNVLDLHVSKSSYDSKGKH